MTALPLSVPYHHTVLDGPVRVLVATDGLPAADGAAALAAALAAERGAHVEVLSVVPPAPVSPHDRERADRERCARRRDAVRAQIERIAGTNDWDVAVEEGAPVSTIAQEAGLRGSHLVLVGLHSHGFAERVFHDDTPQRVLTRLDAPMLAVMPDVRGLFRHVLAAVDFTPSSDLAAQMAALLLADDGVLSLAHVEPPFDLDANGEDRREIYAGGVSSSMERLITQIQLPPAASMEPVVLSGAPYYELQDYVRTSGTQLVAVGSKRRGMVDRLSSPRLPNALLRSAAHSVLIAPER